VDAKVVVLGPLCLSCCLIYLSISIAIRVLAFTGRSDWGFLHCGSIFRAICAVVGFGVVVPPLRTVITTLSVVARCTCRHIDGGIK
jgi:hypothetical protein